jgi:hypothetical protein
MIANSRYMRSEVLRAVNMKSTVLRYDAVQFYTNFPTFHKNVLSPFSGLKREMEVISSSETSVNTRLHSVTSM